MTYDALIWILVAMALFIVEGLTVQIVSVWFAVGAVAAIIPAALGLPFWVQLLFFFATSVLFLIAVRPVIKKRLLVHKQPTNADMVVGQTGLVLVKVDNLAEEGRVSANGLTWTARSDNGEVIPEHAKIIVKRIEGVKLIVVPLNEEGF